MCWPRRSSICRSALAVLVALSVVPCLGAQTPPKERSPFVERPETDLVLLAVRLNGEILNDALAAFTLERGVVLPLGEISRELGFAIDVDVANGTADGFFIAESRRFHLDMRRATVVVNGKQSAFDASRAEVHQDDIYADAALLSQWFPVDFTLDMYSSLLIVRPREPLPVQIRREREKQVEKTLANLGYTGPKLPVIANPYSLFSVPSVDEQLRVTRAPDEHGVESNEVQYSTLLTGDLLGLETNMFVVGGSRDAVSDFRLGMGRRSPHPDLLGGLHAREFGLGEILFPGSNLVALPASGPGLLLSNFPLQQQGQFDQHTFIGDLPLGWEVELFRNDALVAFQQSSPNGRYVFQNIPLLFGVNVFRLVFYGPQGQRRIEIETFNIGQSLTPPGVFQYRIAANDPKSLTRRGIAESSYGLSPHLSASLSLSRIDLIDRGRLDYQTVSLRGYWSRLFAYTDAGRTSGGGVIGRAGVETRIGGLSLGFSRSELRRGYESEIFRPLYGEITSRTALRLGGLVQSHIVPAIPVTLDIVEDDVTGGGKVDQVSNLVSTMFGRTSLSNRLDGFLFRSFKTNAAPKDSVVGSALISRYLRHLSIRGELDYQVRPDPQIISYSGTAETRVLPNYLISGSIVQTVPSKTTHYIAGISRDQGGFGFGVDADVSSHGEVLLRFAMAVGVTRDPVNGRWRSFARPIAARGAIATRVFLDTNGNGRWDQGEKPVSGAGFFVNRASDPTLTDPHGHALLSNLAADRDTDVSLSPSTLEDPLWVAERPGVEFVPRAGKALVVDFPVTITGEITGTIYVGRGTVQEAAPGIVVELVDAAGNVVKSERSAYDGFYDITNVRPGEYTLRVVSGRPARLRLTGEIQKKVKIEPAGTILDGVNFVVGEQAVEPVATETPPPLVAPPVPVPAQPAPATPAPAPPPSAVELTQRGDFRAVLAEFAKSPAINPGDRYYYAVALYETGHYAEARREMAGARVPDTAEGARYRAKIEGAIIWQEQK